MNVNLKNVRLAFPDLFEAQQFKGQGEARFSATFLVEKGSDNEKAVKDAIATIAKEKFGAKMDAKLKSIGDNPQKTCWSDGDNSEYDGFADNMALRCVRKESQGRPLVIDRDKSPLIAADGKPYSGCYVNAKVDMWAQDGDYPGIRCTLMGLQFVKDGDAFGGTRPASESDFDEIADGADADDLA